MKPSFKPKRILWVDLEMTGLDPTTDEILEVAAIVTDWTFAEIATYEGVVRHDAAKLTRLLDGNASFWDPQCAGEGRILLAGNSIHQDRRFIDHWWPQLAQRLHYRMLDVSAWKVVMEGKYGKKFAKPEDHRALEDIRGSIMELRYYLQKVAL